jgi:proteasome component ECM29
VDVIIKDLLVHITNGQWRVRESSCAAIGDILRGRRWPELRDHLAQLWSRLFRALDDVKESVRVAAAGACKRISKVTVVLCKAEAGTSGAEAIGSVLPVLINEGLLSSVNDVRALGLGVMLELAKVRVSVFVPHFCASSNWRYIYSYVSVVCVCLLLYLVAMADRTLIDLSFRCGTQ